MPELYVGLMSGTSLDGVDAVLADLSASPRLVSALHRAFPERLRDALLKLNNPGDDDLARAATTANELTQLYADATSRLLESAKVDAAAIAAIGCHGQTVRHRPAQGYTIQLVNGALLAELCAARVVCDFRSRDIAAGGEGAPLVPAFHQAMFGSSRAARAVVNIGGIANITVIQDGAVVGGFDCGPGNVLMDAWIAEVLRKPYDQDGAWARQGRVLHDLLQQFLAHPYFAQKPPKSTGRETFNLQWLRGNLSGAEAPVDVQATLLELSAEAISRAVAGNHVEGIYACGGGARNMALMDRLAALLAPATVHTTDELGVSAEWVEALAFAWLAQRALKSQPANVPTVTGARGPRVLGAIYPA